MFSISSNFAQQELDQWFAELFRSQQFLSIKKKVWQDACWSVWGDRSLQGLPIAEAMFQPDPAQRREIHANPSAAQTPAASSSAAVETNTVQQAEEERLASVETTMRLHEESMCRQYLSEMPWLDLLVEDDQLWEEIDAVQEQLQEFIEWFKWDHCKRFPLRCTNARLITVECMWSFQYLQSKGWMPRNVTNPKDRYIRDAASTSCSPFYVDPGNLTWDIIYHVLRLDSYVTVAHADPILRTAPGEYGSSRNRSSVGPVNLRGNVLEAVLGDLQAMGAVREGVPWAASSKSRAKDLPYSRPPSS